MHGSCHGFSEPPGSRSRPSRRWSSGGSRTDPELAQPDRDPGIHAFVAAAAPSNSFIGAHGATRSAQWAAYVEHEVPKSKHSHVRNESLVRPARHQRLPLALPTTRMRTRPGRARSSLGSGSGGPLGSAGEPVVTPPGCGSLQHGHGLLQARSAPVPPELSPFPIAASASTAVLVRA